MISVQQTTIQDWNSEDTVGLELWIFSNQSWIDSNGDPHGFGNPNNRVFTQRVPSVTNNTGTRELTVPAFSLVSTRDAIRGNQVRLFFWVMLINGASVRAIKQVPGTEAGLQIPATIISATITDPLFLSATLADLIVYNTTATPPPAQRFPSFEDVQNMIEAAVGTANNPAGTGTELQYRNGDLFGAMPDTAVVLLPTDVVGDTNTGGAQLVHRPTFQYTNPTSFRSVGIGSRPIIGVTTGGEGLFYTPFWLLFGSRLAPIPAGTKGNPCGFEANIFTNQTALDANEAGHPFGATIEGHGGLPLYGTALSFKTDTVAAPIRAHNCNIEKDVAGGSQYGFYASSSGSQSPSAAYSAGGTWDYGLDLANMLVNLGVFRSANNAPAFVSRNSANSGNVTILYLDNSDRIVMGGNVTLPISDAFVQVGTGVDGYLFQKADTAGGVAGRLRFFRQGFGEVMALNGANPSDGTTAATLLVTKGGVTSLQPVVLSAINVGGAGLRALCVAN